MSNWINCDEQMPESGKAVLCYAHKDNGIRTVGYYSPRDMAWFIDSLGRVARSAISHWMPLPEPPPDCEI